MADPFSKQWLTVKNGKRDKTIVTETARRVLLEDSAEFYDSHLLVFLDVFKTSFLVAESLSGVVSEKDSVDPLWETYRLIQDDILALCCTTGLS